MWKKKLSTFFVDNFFDIKDIYIKFVDKKQLYSAFKDIFPQKNSHVNKQGMLNKKCKFFIENKSWHKNQN